MFFAKYDVDGDGEFSYEEGQQLVEDLENDMIDQVKPQLKVHRDKRIVSGSREAQNGKSEDKLCSDPIAHQSRGVRNVKPFQMTRSLIHFIFFQAEKTS